MRTDTAGHADADSYGMGRRAAVLGSPVAHSLSPVLHEAAYTALGLTGWSYERIECDADSLPALVSGLDGHWTGLSVTMPGKRAALDAANEATARARAVGAANTLVQLGAGQWRADCTDVDGVTGALGAVGFVAPPERPAVVLGAGGTANAVLAAVRGLGLSEAVVVVRDPGRAGPARECAERMGVSLSVVRWADTDLRALASDAAVVVSTVPAEAVREVAGPLAVAPCVLDVIYHPWPTPLAAAVLERGGMVATGLDMLLHQAFGQVEQFTGLSAPREAMRDALHEATDRILPLPLKESSG